MRTAESDTFGREALVEALMSEMRKVSAYSVLFSHAVAARLGVNPTDMECADILALYGPMTAGRLAALTSLTTGAITGVLDRLERLGWLRREQDAADRRRVIVHLREEGQQDALPLFAGMAESALALLARYNDADLQLILGFLQQAAAFSLEQTTRVRDLPLAQPDRSAREPR